MTVGPYCVSAPSLCSVVYRRTVDVLERWLSERCWPMQYSKYPFPAEGTPTGGVEGRACSRFSRATATAIAHDDVPDVPETCCPDTESDSGLKSSYGPRRPSVLSPAAVVIVVVRAVAAIAAKEEQCPTEFLVGESRCATQISISLALASSQPDFLLRCTIPFYSLHFVASDSHFHLIAAFIPGPYSCTCARVSYDHHHRHHACHPYVITLLSRPRMSRQGQHFSFMSARHDAYGTGTPSHPIPP